jgi:serine O-acetyltransferase
MPSSCRCSRNLVRTIRKDFDRYVHSLSSDAPMTVGTLLRVMVLFPGIWAILPYRVCHHLLYKLHPRFLGRLLALPAFAVQRIAMVLFGIEIDSRAHIGEGIFVNHFGGIVIGPAYIGANCNISQGVTIGISSMVTGSALDDVPTLGDRVWLGPGVVVAGPITLGDDVTVASNSLVTQDVPARGIAIGVPAEVRSLRGSFRQVSYRGMADDPRRSASLTAAVTAVRDADDLES